jgi:hypothetical protein
MPTVLYIVLRPFCISDKAKAIVSGRLPNTNKLTPRSRRLHRRPPPMSGFIAFTRQRAHTDLSPGPRIESRARRLAVGAEREASGTALKTRLGSI